MGGGGGPSPPPLKKNWGKKKNFNWKEKKIFCIVPLLVENIGLNKEPWIEQRQIFFKKSIDVLHRVNTIKFCAVYVHVENYIV